MDIRERIRLEERLGARELDRVPEWARAEYMERSVPLKELWKYSDLGKSHIVTKRIK